MKAKFSIIVAMGMHREIGANNDLLWHLPKDMQFFKSTTENHIVVMGRKNWESIPEKYRPLSKRKNIVLTRNRNYKAAGATVIHHWDELFNHINDKDKTCFIIGGAEIYKLALASHLVTEMYITQVAATFANADTFFPFVNWEGWKEDEIDNFPADEKHLYSFKITKYTRV